MPLLIFMNFKNLIDTPEAKRRRAKRYQERNKAVGLCIRCPNDALKNRVRCKICLEKAKIRRAKYK